MSTGAHRLPCDRAGPVGRAAPLPRAPGLPGPARRKPTVSVIICSIDPGKFAAASRNYEDLLRDEPFELIGIHDTASLCEGYNRGVRESTGDLLIFSHDDVEVLAPDFGPRLRGHMSRYDLIGVAGTTRLIDPLWDAAGIPYVYGQVAHANPKERCYDVVVWGAPARSVPGVQALDGLFLCARREVVEAIPFDERTFHGIDFYDMDFTFSAHLRGFRLAVCNDLPMIHGSPGVFGRAWLRYADLFVRKYRDRMERMERRPFFRPVVKVKTKQEVVEVMTPAHWGGS